MLHKFRIYDLSRSIIIMNSQPPNRLNFFNYSDTLQHLVPRMKDVGATHTNLVAVLMALPSLKDLIYKAANANTRSTDVVETTKPLLLELTKAAVTVLRANMDVALMDRLRRKERSSWDALMYQKTDKVSHIITACVLF